MLSIRRKLFLAGIFCFTMLAHPFFVFAQSTIEIQKNIQAKNKEIQLLEQEIQSYAKQANAIAAEANSLESVVRTITKNQQRLQSNISLTNKKIEKANLTIRQNEDQIHDLGLGIVSNTSALTETLRTMNQNDERSFLELIASQQSISEFLRDVDEVAKVQESVKNHVGVMRDTKQGLEIAQQSLTKNKQELERLKNQLGDQKKIVDQEQREKNALLIETKNQEAVYQSLMADRQAKVNQLNAEIFDFESKLKFTLNPNTLPKIGSAPLAWSLENVLITQRFGKTVSSSRLYVSGSHSGVDFRAAVGTPVYAVADGVVEGVGDTDQTCPRASFGKWIFIKHTNGLSTVYGHLSLIKVSQKQKISKGDLIGYSGNTGHSTAPHLHITVYASNGVEGEEGVRVAEKPSISCNGKVYRMPLAPTSAYLDPLLYFPRTTANMFKDGKATPNE